MNLGPVRNARERREGGEGRGRASICSAEVHYESLSLNPHRRALRAEALLSSFDGRGHRRGRWLVSLSCLMAELQHWGPRAVRPTLVFLCVDL